MDFADASHAAQQFAKMNFQTCAGNSHVCGLINRAICQELTKIQEKNKQNIGNNSTCKIRILDL